MKKTALQKIFFISFFLCVFLCACKQSDNANTNEKSVLQFEAMNTFMTLQSFGSNANIANNAVKNSIAFLESKMSTTKPESDIYRLNHAATYPVHVDSIVLYALNFALNIAQKTDNALNPAIYPITFAYGFTNGNYQVPNDKAIDSLLLLTHLKNIKIHENSVTMQQGMMLDLGAIGKGFAGDIAIQTLKKYGIKSALIDLGGNIQTLGCKTNASKWNVGITSPYGDGAIGGVKVCDMAVVTSGGYERFFEQNGERYIHIFDSKTGKPVNNGIASVTIITASGLYADALSTALFVCGYECAVKFYKEALDFDMIIVFENKTVAYTKGLENILTLSYAFDNSFVIE